MLATLYSAAAGAATARIYVWNTAGAIGGSVLAGFYLLPALGFAGSLERSGLHEVEDLLVALTLDEAGSRDFAGRTAPITDDENRLATAGRGGGFSSALRQSCACPGAESAGGSPPHGL